MTDSNDTEPLKAGDHFGDYVVERKLGSGAMGAVYLVRAPDGSLFAVKIMFPGKMTHDLRSRFAREADFAMKIRHRNLISVYDVGEDPETGLCYIIMDYVPGGTLADRIKARGKLPVDEAVKIGASAFSMCGQLAEIALSPGLREVGNRAFAWSALRKITFPASVTKIGNLCHWPDFALLRLWNDG